MARDKVIKDRLQSSEMRLLLLLGDGWSSNGAINGSASMIQHSSGDSISQLKEFRLRHKSDKCQSDGPKKS